MEVKTAVHTIMERVRRFGIKEWGIVLVAGVCLLILAIPGGKTQTESAGEGRAQESRLLMEESSTQEYTERMERRLEEALQKVAGIGRVTVMITVKSTTEKVVLKDEPTETERMVEQDSEGGSRTTVSNVAEESTILVDGMAGSEPYVMKEIYPEITGVLVIAQGSQTGTVDYDILAAVQVLFDVPAHKIKIMKMKE